MSLEAPLLPASRLQGHIRISSCWLRQTPLLVPKPAFVSCGQLEQQTLLVSVLGAGNPKSGYGGQAPWVPHLHTPVAAGFGDPRLPGLSPIPPTPLIRPWCMCCASPFVRNRHGGLEPALRQYDLSESLIHPLGPYLQMRSCSAEQGLGHNWARNPPVPGVCPTAWCGGSGRARGNAGDAMWGPLGRGWEIVLLGNPRKRQGQAGRVLGRAERWVLPQGPMEWAAGEWACLVLSEQRQHGVWGARHGTGATDYGGRAVRDTGRDPRSLGHSWPARSPGRRQGDCSQPTREPHSGTCHPWAQCP